MGKNKPEKSAEELAEEERLKDEQRAKIVAGTSNSLGGVGRAVGSWVGAFVEGAKEGRNSERPSSKADNKED